MNQTLISLAKQLPYGAPSDVAAFLLKFGQEEPRLKAEEFSNALESVWPTIKEGLRHIQLPWTSSYSETRRKLLSCKRAGIGVSSFAARIELEGFFLARISSPDSFERQADVLENWIAQVQARRKEHDPEDLDRALRASIGSTAEEAISLLQSKCGILRDGTEDFLNDLNQGFDAWASNSPAFHSILSCANAGEAPGLLRKVIASNKYSRIRNRTLCESMATRFFLHFRDPNTADSLHAQISVFLDADSLRSLERKLNS